MKNPEDWIHKLNDVGNSSEGLKLIRAIQKDAAKYFFDALAELTTDRLHRTKVDHFREKAAWYFDNAPIAHPGQRKKV